MNQVIHIGFSKSASSFLQSIFSTGSGINYIYKSGRFSILENQFELPTLSGSMLNFESDEHIVLPEWHPHLHRVRVTRLCALNKAFNEIKEQVPKAKIIIVLRNQYSMIVSRYSQYVVGSGGKLSFEEFVSHMLGDKKGESFYENFYYQIVMMLEECFGKENVLTLFYEDIKENSSGALRQISDFSKHDFTDLSPNFRSKRQGLSEKGLGSVRRLNNILVSKHQPKTEEVSVMVPKFVYNNLVRSLRLFDSFYDRDKIKLPENLKERLYQVFHDDNFELSKFFKRDLGQLGYF